MFLTKTIYTIYVIILPRSLQLYKIYPPTIVLQTSILKFRRPLERKAFVNKLRGKFRRPLERQSFVNKLRGKFKRPLERQSFVNKLRGKFRRPLETILC